MYSELGMWLSLSSHMQDVIQMQWTPQCFCQFLPSCNEVQAWVTEDQSCLVSSGDGAFLRHSHCNGKSNLYRSSALPLHAWSADGGKRYEFASIAQRALKFRWVLGLAELLTWLQVLVVTVSVHLDRTCAIETTHVRVKGSVEQHESASCHRHTSFQPTWDLQGKCNRRHQPTSWCARWSCTAPDSP